MNMNHLRQNLGSPVYQQDPAKPSMNTPQTLITTQSANLHEVKELIKSTQHINEFSISMKPNISLELMGYDNSQVFKLSIMKPMEAKGHSKYDNRISELQAMVNKVSDKNKPLAELNNRVFDHKNKQQILSRVPRVSQSLDASSDQNVNKNLHCSRIYSNPQDLSKSLPLLDQNKALALTEILLTHSASKIFAPIPYKDNGLEFVPPRLFQGLFDLLRKHYSNLHIDEEDLNIKEPELKLLKAILIRKYNYKGLGFESLNNFLLAFKKIDHYRSNKRLEENYKFVLSRCIKHLKKQLPKSKHRKIRKREFDNYFYQYYFGTTCHWENMDFRNFSIPRASNDTMLRTKTISDEYIARLTQSKLFTEECLSYIESQLKYDYRVEMNSKLEKLVEGWEASYKEANDKFRAIEGIVDNIINSQRFKLPWVDSEVNVAIDSVKSIFNKYTSSC